MDIKSPAKHKLYHKLFNFYFLSDFTMNSFRSNLINENGNLLWLPSDFYYDVLKIKFDGRGKSCDDERSDDGAHYIYEKMGNMILVEMNSKTDVKILLHRTKSKKVTLLDSMIDLRTNLRDNTFSKPTMLLENDSTLLTEKEIDSIIKWCSHNGYPFEISNKEFKKPPYKLDLFKKITREQKRFGFKVGDFLISLNNLYCCYKMYSVLTNEIDSIEEHLFLIDDTEPFSFIDLYGKTENECKEQFNKQFNKIALDNSASIENDFVAKSLFDAALYQLALIMYDKEKEIRICICCGHRFAAENKKKKYCDACSPQKAYAKRKREAKRQSKNE